MQTAFLLLFYLFDMEKRRHGFHDSKGPRKESGKMDQEKKKKDNQQNKEKEI